MDILLVVEDLFEPKSSTRTVLVLAMAHSVPSTSCASNPVRFGCHCTPPRVEDLEQSRAHLALSPRIVDFSRVEVPWLSPPWLSLHDKASRGLGPAAALLSDTGKSHSSYLSSTSTSAVVWFPLQSHLLQTGRSQHHRDGQYR